MQQKGKLSAAFLAVASTFIALLAGSVALTTPSMADTVHYALVNVQTSSGGATFSGGFDFNTSTNAYTNINIVGTGDLFVSPESFDSVFSSSATSLILDGLYAPEGIELYFNTSLASPEILAGALDNLVPPSNYGNDYCEGPCEDLIGAVHVAATPLPPALPLFASGLGVLGLLGWRRKRKKAAAMAPA